MMLNVLAIDPSINTIGFAILQIHKRKIGNLINKTFKSNRSMSLLEICEATYHYIRIDTIVLHHVVIEYPQFMMGQKGLISAQRGYTLDLACICGYLAARFRTDTTFYTPAKWKGQKPKTATQAAFKRMFPKYEAHSEHSIDATMLGHYFCKQYDLIS